MATSPTLLSRLRDQPPHPATDRVSLRRTQRKDHVPMLPRRCCPLALLARSLAFVVACPVFYGVASRLRRPSFHDVHPLLLLPLYAAWRVHNSRRVREVPAWRVPVASLCFCASSASLLAGQTNGGRAATRRTSHGAKGIALTKQNARVPRATIAGVRPGGWRTALREHLISHACMCPQIAPDRGRAHIS